MFHSLPLLHLKGYEPDSFSYCFFKVSTVFRHSFRLLFWNISQNNNLASSGHMSFACATEFVQPLFSPLLLWKTFAVYILLIIYFKTTWGLIIKIVWHVSVDIMETFWNFRLRCHDRSFLWISEHNAPNKRRYLDIKNIFKEQKEHLLSNWQSREWKHPKIKGKRLIWLLFWFVTKLLDARCT